MSDPAVDIPVLIVGGGPAGLCCSLLLARHGIGSLLVERRPSLSTHPRARGISTRTMELFRVWGVEAAVLEQQLDCQPFIAVSETLVGPETGRSPWEPPRRAGVPNPSPSSGCLCPQDVLDPLLLEHARTYPQADIRLGAEMTSVTQDDGGVTATIVDRSSGAATEVRAHYLVAADGTNSPVRRRLGIATQGIGPFPSYRPLSILFRAPLTPALGRTPCRQQVIQSPTRTGIFFLYGREDRWVFSTSVDLDAGERAEDFDAARCAEVIRAASGVDGLDVRVESVQAWELAARSAERFRQGRIFLAGDAAHQMTPAGALGLNTAVHDAHNLAWKLAAVLSGWARAALLDSYETERLPVGRRNTQRSMRFGPDPEDNLTPEAVDLGVEYASAAVIGDGTVPPVNPTGEYLPSARPGCRAPHLWVERDGRRMSTVDLFDTFFVVLAGDAGGAWCAAATDAGACPGLPVTGWTVGTAGDLVDRDGEWRRLYGVGADGMVLVRPDGHVAYRSPCMVDDPGAALRHVARTLAGGAG